MLNFSIAGLNLAQFLLVIQQIIFQKLMKKVYLFLPVIALLILFSSCEKQALRSTLEGVPQCMDLDMSRDNVLDRIEGEYGTLREVTLWVPVVHADPTAAKNGETVAHLVWVIMPDAYPDLMFEPCNLPEAQLIHNRRVSFSGHSLLENPYTSGFEGLTPFNLTEITDGVEGPTEHEPC